MSAIILIEADNPDLIHIVRDFLGNNRVFDDAASADNWIERHAKMGWCTRIIEIED
jgi:hypothetical protein